MIPHLVQYCIVLMFTNKYNVYKTVFVISANTKELQRTGIRCTDPRMTNMMKMLYNMKPHNLITVSQLKLDTGAFRMVLTKNTWLINKSFQNQFIIPKFQEFCSEISQIYEMVSVIIITGNIKVYKNLSFAIDFLLNGWSFVIFTVQGKCRWQML